MFPKSLLLAFVASSLFLANVGVEAGTSDKTLTSTDLDHSPGYPSSITITSSLSTTPPNKGFFGICSLPSSPSDGIIVINGDSRTTSVQSFINEAQMKAKCTWLSPTDVHCVEQGGKEDMTVAETISWVDIFCMRCYNAGGKNRADLSCADKDDYPPKFVYGTGTPGFTHETSHIPVDDESKEGEKEKEAAGGKSKDDRKIDGSN
ncbi:uncharacterized protein UDID_19524 [Ustilago sp. UG-2017a]|nr:uncharacterized protein UDID_19524 [Ustilago sp. UG-2017a]